MLNGLVLVYRFSTLSTQNVSRKNFFSFSLIFTLRWMHQRTTFTCSFTCSPNPPGCHILKDRQLVYESWIEGEHQQDQYLLLCEQDGALQRDFQQVTGVNTFDQTIRNRLQHCLVDPALTACHCGAQLAFAIKHQNWLVHH